MPLFQKTCFLCGKPLLCEPHACEGCARSLRRVDSQILQRMAPAVQCDTLTVPVYYEGILRDAMLRYKFRGHGETHRALAACIAAVLPERTFDTVTFAPLPRSRENERGYNQAALLAKDIARQLHIPCRALLHRTRQNAQQHMLTVEKRTENVKDLYEVRRPERVREQRILLIDDIVTTGSTMAAMAQALREAGAREIHGAAVALTPYA